MLHRLPPDVEADQQARSAGSKPARSARSVPTRTVHRSCSLCEASCGLSFEVAGDRGDERIVSVRPDHDDVSSKGYVCPKGVAMAAVHHDSDRLRTPMRRRSNGDFEPISWSEAFELVADRLNAIRREHGARAEAVGLLVPDDPATPLDPAALPRASTVRRARALWASARRSSDRSFPCRGFARGGLPSGGDRQLAGLDREIRGPCARPFRVEVAQG